MQGSKLRYMPPQEALRKHHRKLLIHGIRTHPQILEVSMVVFHPVSNRNISIQDPHRQVAVQPPWSNQPVSHAGETGGWHLLGRKEHTRSVKWEKMSTSATVICCVWSHSSQVCPECRVTSSKNHEFFLFPFVFKHIMSSSFSSKSITLLLFPLIHEPWNSAVPGDQRFRVSAKKKKKKKTPCISC